MIIFFLGLDKLNNLKFESNLNFNNRNKKKIYIKTEKFRWKIYILTYYILT